MQPTKEKIKGIKYELSFEIPADVFETKLSEQLAELKEIADKTTNDKHHN